jgi:hypothetical protein
MDTGSSFLGGKAADAEADHSKFALTSTKQELYFHFSIYLHGIVFNC